MPMGTGGGDRGLVTWRKKGGVGRAGKGGTIRSWMIPEVGTLRDGWETGAWQEEDLYGEKDRSGEGGDGVGGRVGGSGAGGVRLGGGERPGEVVGRRWIGEGGDNKRVGQVPVEWVLR
jgi:hypothetical protein